MPSQIQAVAPRRLRVFLCHSSDDKPIVRNLYQQLRDCNVDPWLDEEKLIPGQDWDLEIQKAVRKSDAILICLSPDFVIKEGYGQKEIKLALDTALEKPEGTIFIIPLRLEECKVPLRLQRYQRVDYFADNSFDKLISALKKRSESLKEQIEPIGIQMQMLEFVAEFQSLTRTASKADNLINAFQVAAGRKLNISGLKFERDRQNIRHNHVIIEFKNKGSFRGRKDSKPFKETLDQLVKISIPQQAHIDNRAATDYIGICFDGEQLAFVFIELNGNNRVTDLRPLDEHSVAELALVLKKDNRIELTPQNVVDDFGPYSKVASLLLGALWEDLDTAIAKKISRVDMLYSEWNTLFEQSTSLGEIGQSKLNVYLTAIGLPPNVDPTRFLFVLHTYHALFFKLLAAEVVLTNRLILGTPSDYCFSTSALSDTDLMASLYEKIEESDLFRKVNILNFVEGSFFAWYVVKPSRKLIAAIRTLMQLLSLYRLSDLQLTHTRDIVKRIYQQLVPAALRHNIGEYFTPEWLVEFTLDRAEYNGSEILDKKFLDPCCGSGNFLIHAIDRYKTQARLAGKDDAWVLRNILDRIVGFDLNPLAVLTARVNYLIGISDLINTESEVEIPIYQADAIYAPTITTTDSAANPICTYEIGTRKKAITLRLPEALIKNNRLFAIVLKIMDQAVWRHDTANSFLTDLNSESEYVAEPYRDTWQPFLLDMFRQVEDLERQDWNHVWCRIVRNYFASVAVGPCQFIASNPPWVRWSELPTSYTNRIKPTCDAYKIFSEDRYFGGNELDISGMITYTVADKWLDARGGRLSFVITKTHFQSQSSGGFRRFEVKGTPLKVTCVDDFEKVRPFISLGNKPAVLSLEKGQPTSYPVEYIEWERTTSSAIPDDINLQTAYGLLKQSMLEANSLSDTGQRWSILPSGRFNTLRVLDGEDLNIEGRKGILTDLNGAYFIEPLGKGSRPNTIRFRNIPERGRHSVPQITSEIELDLVYPLIKGGGNIRAFYATSSPLCVIIPNKRISIKAIPTVSDMKDQNYRKALQYFYDINAVKASNGGYLLEERSTWKTRMKPQFERAVQLGKIVNTDIPFYAIYDVGDYTFAPYKVVWAEMAGTLQAAVISKDEVPYSGTTKVVVPDHKVYYAAFDDLDPAYYVCGLLNSEPIRTFIDSFTIKIQVGTLFRHVKLPLYDPSLSIHRELVRYSRAGLITVQREAIDELANQAITRIAPTYRNLKLPW